MYSDVRPTGVKYALSFGVAEASRVDQMNSIYLFFVIHSHSLHQQQVLCHQM